tara:strand:- start:731 stop:1819 length:1089 start_codon:yes stop_codon:yes gene_type:complete
MIRTLLTILLLAAMLIGLPLAGVALQGRSLQTFTEFPPLTRYVEHAPFSWMAFSLLALAILVFVLPFDFRTFRARESRARPVAPFPRWGWAGVGLGMTAWVVTWTRMPALAPLQPFTFTPLWIGYIITVNALTYRLAGRCMMTQRPRFFGGLFFLSAGFWWFFEYLNRFVQNWYYTGLGTFSPLAYFGYATFPFATVLPAVLGTYEFLAADPRRGAGLDDFPAIRLRHPRLGAALTLSLAAAGLAGIGVWPDYLFPLLWVAPLYIVTPVEVLAGRESLLAPIGRGHWRQAYLLAAAALVCGFFWEMWNYGSVARWIYEVPYVGGVRLFEMPLLGYAGYLPFGLQCAVIARLFFPDQEDFFSR